VCQEYAEKLKDSGVHGAVLVLDVNVTADVLANLLAIPTAKSYVRRHLATEYDVIVQPARCACSILQLISLSCYFVDTRWLRDLDSSVQSTLTSFHGKTVQRN